MIGLITPWNFPTLMVVWKMAAALITGNTVHHQAAVGVRR